MSSSPQVGLSEARGNPEKSVFVGNAELAYVLLRAMRFVGHS